MKTTRKRLLTEYQPNESSRQSRAMKLHQKTLKQWEETSNRLAARVGRDPSTLAMNGEDEFRRTNEQRFLISQVINALAQKDPGVWNLNPRIGDLYAQLEHHDLSAIESIGDPFKKDNVEGSRPTDWFHSKYYKKLAKQLHGHIEKIHPFEPDFSGLVVIGRPLSFTAPVEEIATEEEEIIIEETEQAIEERQSTVRVDLHTNRLFFTTAPGVTQAKSVEVTNTGTSAVYYRWELAHDIDLMIGSGSSRTPIRKQIDDSDVDAFDWRASDSFILPRDIQPRTRSEFLFTQRSGSILPGGSETFSFAFKSDVPGCYTQRWVMRLTPSAECEKPLTVSLRGCCEVDPPDLSSFKKSIDENLHESERSRCIEEVISSVFDRVSHLTSKTEHIEEERIEGDVLVDDRAPIFDAANDKWGIKYSPGLYASFLSIAEEAWDSLGITGFERYWDSDITSLSKLVLRIQDGEKKRHLLYKINETLQMNMTHNSVGSLSYSIAYVQLSSIFSKFSDDVQQVAASHNLELPPFIAPKVAEPDEDELESTRRKHKKGREPKKQAAKKGGKKASKEDEAARNNLTSSNSQRPINPSDITPEVRADIVSFIKEQLKQKLTVFEQLAGESRGVSKQLTRINEVDRLETNLDLEVEDDL